MEGEIISRENIKPSSPTPLDKRTHKISLLDQVFLSMFVPLVLYYPNLENTVASKNNIIASNTDEFISHTTQILKHSLSTTLSLFYPFAGRFRDRFSVDCNDQGTPFLVVKFKESLSDFLKKPDPEICRVHTPVHLTTESDVAMIQVNYFDCGGVAIGSAISHKLADGVTMVAFMKAWAAAASAAVGGGTEEETSMFSPSYTALSFFPQNESMPMEVHLFSHLRKLVKIGKSTMRRYVFDASAISKLKAQLLLSPDETLERRRPSRVEIVSALLWKCFMVASKKSVVGNQNDGDSSSMCFISHLVNMRRRANPPFPEYSFGNFVWSTTESTLMNSQTHSDDDDDLDLKHVFDKVRCALSKVDEDFVKRMQGEEGYPGYYKNVQETWNAVPKENANVLSFTSWCNFGLYDADFGWGKPTWISKCDAGSNNADSRFVQVAWLTDTRDGDGVEAWLTMDHRYNAEFDKINELNDLACVDPSPLDIYNQSLLCNK